MAGEIQVAAFWTATVTGLGSQSPSAVAFTKSSNFPTTWEEVTLGTDVFIKFPKIYRKINTIEDNQITSFTISNSKLDNDYRIYPCFIDENERELDYILIGKYMSKSSSECNSVESGTVAMRTIATGRTNAQAKGAGYQIMDWRMQRLWQDLLICAMETVNINSGSGITTDALGVYWGSDLQWIDGFCHDSQTWRYSNSPNKYIDSPTASTDGYADINTVANGGYLAPTTSSALIQRLGYDESAPFFNYPSKVGGTTYTTYYCDEYWYSSGNRPVICFVGFADAAYGAFYCNGSDDWAGTGGVRLCYRPLETATIETGTYKWLDTPSPSDPYTYHPNISFVSNGQNCTGMRVYYTSDEFSISYAISGVYVVVYNGTSWTDTAYQTISVSTEQAVELLFYNWAITDDNLIKQTFYRFKHFYRKDLVGSGSYQFRQFTPTATYSITSECSNCTPETTNPTTIIQGGTATLKYIANTGYELPNLTQENCTNCTLNSWDATTGVAVISNPTGDVVITVTAIKSLEKLATPQNVSADGTVVSWDEVENATSYDIYVDGAVYATVVATVYEVTGTNLKVINSSYSKQEETLKLL